MLYHRLDDFRTFASTIIELRHVDARIVREQVFTRVFVGASVEKRADQSAVEIAGSGQRVADWKSEVEISRRHEPEHKVNGVQPPDRASAAFDLQFGSTCTLRWLCIFRARQLGDLRRSTLPFGDGNETLVFASTVAKEAAPRRAVFKETRERRMAKAPPSTKRDRIKAFTPALVDYTNDVIYGDLWERKALSKRDRSLITVAALVATYRPEQLVSHLSRAIANGVTQEEITEVITHMAFYAGWPAAMSAAQVAYTVLVEGNKGE